MTNGDEAFTCIGSGEENTTGFAGFCQNWPISGGDESKMTLVPKLTHRDSLGFWLNHMELFGEGVEVGSAFGQYAGRILETWLGKKLYLVDPWEKQDPEKYRENQDNMDFVDWYARCQALVERDARATLMKGYSADIAPLFADLSLDFAYIDGNHDYAYVLQDLDLWFPKVRVGGLIGGHDMYDAHEGGAWCGVASAVLRWMKEKAIPFTVTPCTSWWVIKQ